MTEQLHFHFSLSFIGEGNGNPLQLQYSCLENPRDGGPWWAAVYGVVQSWTRLKRLSSSSSFDHVSSLLKPTSDFLLAHGNSQRLNGGLRDLCDLASYHIFLPFFWQLASWPAILGSCSFQNRPRIFSPLIFAL